MTRRSDAPGLRPPKSPRIEDAATDQAIREHERTFADILALPAASMKIIPDVVLAMGQDTHIPHGLGRAPRAVIHTAVRGGPTAVGLIEEIRRDVDRSIYVKLNASGWGATITVDLVLL